MTITGVSGSAPQVHCQFLPAIVPHLQGYCHSSQSISIVSRFIACPVLY
ncbi:hypothetical protein YPPY72_0919 [Yersinia pestis PY-72]|nr:hypothetical protein YPPY54_0834 [Yersinia pestis PY-54]EIS82808.1 hypothetical protein YPPY72_0919 [Yersinia pestis PY-72]